ncbi:MAG: biopolymer transporter ExbD [Planctomycetota bacterium]
MHVTKRFHAEELEMNITPMIDVVFLLLIFFLVVSEIVSYDRIEGLELPYAAQAKEESNVPDRIIVSIVPRKRVDPEDGKMKMMDTVYIQGRIRRMYDLEEPGAEAKDEVLEYLRVERQYRGLGDEPSEQPILVQADKDVEWRVVQNVLERAARLQFYRISFGVRKAQG